MASPWFGLINSEWSPADCTYALAAAVGPGLLWDGGPGSQGGLRPLGHRWFWTHRPPGGSCGGRGPETRDQFGLGLTTWRVPLRRTRVGFNSWARWRPVLWSARFGDWRVKETRSVMHVAFCLSVLNLEISYCYIGIRVWTGKNDYLLHCCRVCQGWKTEEEEVETGKRKMFLNLT